MAALTASAIGVLVACGVYLLLRARTFSVILGLTLLSYATNLFLLAMGGLAPCAAPVLGEARACIVDPLPQALVLTAIVISFGMTALLVVLALRGQLVLGTDRASGRGARADREPVVDDTTTDGAVDEVVDHDAEAPR